MKRIEMPPAVATRNARLGLFAIAVIVLMSSAARAATCSLATVSGNYAVATIGQQAGVFQAEVFRMTSDGNGNLSGTGAESLNGTIHSGVTIAGTYTVASNCVFTSTTTDNVGNTFNITGEIAESGAQITGISTNAVELQYTAYRLTLTSCTQSSGAGAYTFQLNSPLTPFGPAIGTGQTIISKAGKGTGSSVGNFSGTIVNSTETTTFTINSDCTFTAITKNSNGTSGTSFGVGGIVQNDVEGLYVGTDAGWVSLGTSYKK